MPRLLELFSGTGSVGRAFEELGWEVFSLDMDFKSNATITMDFMEFDWTVFPKDYFQCIWASPPCTMYSIARTTAKTPRDLEGSNRLVQRVLDCIEYFMPKTWFMENPQSGYLKSQPVVQGLRYRDTSYCVWPGGFEYRKLTRIWTNAHDDWSLPCCSRSCPCEISKETGRHPQTAQRAPGKFLGKRMENDKRTLDQLHSIPHELCLEIAREATRNLSLP